LHAGPGAAEKIGVWKLALQRLHNAGSVEIARSLACGDKDAHKI